MSGFLAYGQFGTFPSSATGPTTGTAASPWSSATDDDGSSTPGLTTASTAPSPWSAGSINEDGSPTPGLPNEDGSLTPGPMTGMEAWLWPSGLINEDGSLTPGLMAGMEASPWPSGLPNEDGGLTPRTTTDTAPSEWSPPPQPGTTDQGDAEQPSLSSADDPEAWETFYHSLHHEELSSTTMAGINAIFQDIK